LLTKGKANPNGQDNQKFSPLHLATQRGRLDIIKLLVSLFKSLAVFLFASFFGPFGLRAFFLDDSRQLFWLKNVLKTLV